MDHNFKAALASVIVIAILFAIGLFTFITIHIPGMIR